MSMYIDSNAIDPQDAPIMVKQRTLSSYSLPPAPLVAITAIIIFFLYISSNVDSLKTQARRADEGIHMFLILIFIVLLFFMWHTLWDGNRLVFRQPVWYEARMDQSGDGGSGGWSFSSVLLVAVLVMLLVLVSYKPA